MKKNKRIIITFCVTMIFMLRFTVTALATGGSFTFNISGVDSVKQGQAITLKVDANKAGLTDGKAIINYDESKLTYQGGKMVYSTTDDELEFVVNSNEKGKLIVVWASVKPMKTSGTVFTLDFMVCKSVEDGQSTEVGLEVEYANDSEGNSLDISTNGNKDSMTIAIGNKTPESNQNSNQNQDQNQTQDSNQNQTQGLNSDTDKNESLNSDKDQNLNSNIDKDQNSDSDIDLTQDSDNPNKDDLDTEINNTGGYTNIIKYLAVFATLGVSSIGIFKFISRFKGKGE